MDRLSAMSYLPVERAFAGTGAPSPWQLRRDRLFPAGSSSNLRRMPRHGPYLRRQYAFACRADFATSFRRSGLTAVKPRSVLSTAKIGRSLGPHPRCRWRGAQARHARDVVRGASCVERLTPHGTKKYPIQSFATRHGHQRLSSVQSSLNAKVSMLVAFEAKSASQG